jgi:hypothetical protein
MRVSSFNTGIVPPCNRGGADKFFGLILQRGFTRLRAMIRNAYSYWFRFWVPPK